MDWHQAINVAAMAIMGPRIAHDHDDGSNFPTWVELAVDCAEAGPPEALEALWRLDGQVGIEKLVQERFASWKARHK